MPLGKLGRVPLALRTPTGLPSTLNILLPGLPCLVIPKFDMIAEGASELEEDSVIELDEISSGALEELETGSEQFSPMQNMSVSPGVPMSVILRPVLEPLYQRIAG